jgi:hypothetical protein
MKKTLLISKCEEDSIIKFFNSNNININISED